jgi:thymidylate synthase
LGELCWYLSKKRDLSFIEYYIGRYAEFAEGEIVHGGYGPRLFDCRGHDQVQNVISLLRSKPASRQAVIQIFEAEDIAQQHKDIPCTCTLQYLIRNEALFAITYMRSNDAYMGLPHDVFCFTFLQELIASELKIDLGTYKHMVGSLHLYEENADSARKFLDEGWQSTIMMPPMPRDDPLAQMRRVLQAEAVIRTHGEVPEDLLDGVEPYWADLVRLLAIFRATKDRDRERIKAIRGRMASKEYRLFIDARLGDID